MRPIPMRSSTLLTLALSLAFLTAGEPVTTPPAAPGQPVPAWAPSPASQAAMTALIDQAIALGFPDTAGSTLHYGTLTITAPGRKPEAIKGLHAQRPDGSWLVLLAYVPGTGAVVDATQVKPVKPEALLALAHQELPWLPYWEYQMQQMTGLAPEARAMLGAGFDGWAVASLNQQALMMRGDDPVALFAASVAQVVALQRLAVPHAAEAVAMLGAVGLLVTTDPARPAPILDLTGRQAWSDIQRRSRQVKEGNGSLRLPSPEAAVRLGFFHWFEQQLVAGDARFSALPVERAVAGACAFAGATDEPSRTRIHQLAERAALPITAPVGADLATRLVSWRAGTSRGNTAATATADPDFSPQDLDGLVALAGDRRLSRWLDSGQPRTVGDQALRALASVMQVDPRILIQRNPQAPWDEAERHAVVTRLATWWAANRQRPLVDLTAEVLVTMPLADVAALLDKASDPARRATWFDRLATAWAVLPPAFQGQPQGGDDDSPDAVGLVTILRLGKDHARFATVVDAWPVSGRYRLMLATWHVLRGRRQPLDECFAEALGQPAAPGGGGEASLLRRIIAIEESFPTPSVLRQAQAALQGPVDQEPARSVIRTVFRGSGWSPERDLVQSWAADDQAANRVRERNAEVFQMALNAQLQADHRSAPADLVTQAVLMAKLDAGQEAYRLQAERNAAPTKPAPPTRLPPTDLRVADCVAVLANWGAGSRREDEKWEEYQRDIRFDLMAPIAERDARLKVRLERLTEDVQKGLPEAGLPLSIPGLDLTRAATGAPQF